MNLAEYFERYGITKKFFAKESKVSLPTIFSILNGKQFSLTTAKKIEKASDGKVTLKDLMKGIIQR